MAVLGCILLTPQLLGEADALEPQHFFYPWNQAVFSAVLETGGDRFAVMRQMQEDGTIENLHYVGRGEYFAQLLLAAVPSPADFDEMVGAVRRCPRCVPCR